ncbi:FUSC family protein [Jiella mangrovi]|uniref:FUSC family protein n=1 Tax=Jiella mangrovi TaxID=2821407 RepID=A0ABS4BDC8_9HYPH|nr:FUSC family protein [Jiella mangrovi]MBP0613985.1 FUSC family protein [Jiella mangrovi]
MFAFALPSRLEWIFAAKTFAASMLALFIALSADLPRPYWAMATVFIVANPLAGATRSKALYRALGTVIGASAAVFFTPLFVGEPVVLSAVVAIWTGGLLFVSFLDRTPRSYMFMLSGYTLPLIAMPTVGDPSTVFDVAVARSQEIILGITCTSLISALVLPQSLGSVVAARVDGWLSDARSWTRDVLGGQGESRLAETVKLAPDVKAVDQLIGQLRYDPEMTGVVWAARQLRGRLVMLPALLSSLADRLAAIRDDDGKLPPEIAILCWEIDAWIASEGQVHRDGSRRLAARIADVQARKEGAGPGWDGLLGESALARLADLVDLWSDCVTLKGEILAGRKARRDVPLRLSNVATEVPHYDFGMMAFAAISAIGGLFVACLVWIYTGWDQGAGFVLIAGVSGAFFAALDNPLPQLKQMAILTAVGCVMAGVYVFGILPLVTTFVGLVVVFAPVFLLLPILIGRPKTMFIGILLAINSATLISLHDVYTANFTQFVNGAIASVLGAVFTLVWTILTRPFGSALAARRLQSQGWREIADLAAGRRADAAPAFAGRFFDRLGQLVPRLGAQAGEKAAEAFAEMRVGLNILDLTSARKDLEPRQRAAIEAVLSQVAAFYRQRASGVAPAEPPEMLRDTIDAALRSLCEHTQSAGARRPTPALVGLRRALFAAAPPPGPDRPEGIAETFDGYAVAAE